MKCISRSLKLMIVLCTMCLFFPSCKSASVVQEVRSSEVQKFRSVDTVVMRDSVFVREVMKGDTVYLTRTEWRERWRTQIVRDTIRNTEYITQVIEKPPVRYVPKFYRWCTIALWAIGLSAIGYWLVKWWLRRRL